MGYTVGIAEIVLWSNGLEKSLQFYRDLLGFELISSTNLRNRFLKVGDGHAGIPAMIVLVPKPPEVAARPSGGQLHHMAFEIAPENFDRQREILVAAGYLPRAGKHPVLASRTMYVDDPDGNEVEFICSA